MHDIIQTVDHEPATRTQTLGVNDYTTEEIPTRSRTIGARKAVSLKAARPTSSKLTTFETNTGLGGNPFEKWRLTTISYQKDVFKNDP